MIKLLISSAALGLYFLCNGQAVAATRITETITLNDHHRDRSIPVELYFPAKSATCNSTHRCQVAILSAGYGISHKEYTFMADALNEIGYLVVSINHQLPSDPQLDRGGDIRRQLKAMWQQGALNIQYVQGELAKSYPGFDWQRVVLVGHSLGGDSSAFRANGRDPNIAALITLDNRRAPLPRTSATKVLSIRASDTEADAGVIPPVEEQREFGTCIVKIEGARHNDMEDGGPPELKRKLIQAVDRFLRQGADGTPLYACDAQSPLK